MKTIHYHRTMSCALTGIEGQLVEIEVSVLPGLPSFEVSGRGDSAIKESRDRVRAAIRYSGYQFPKGRVVASYAPASLPKQGSAFDLPLALAVLTSSNQAVRMQHAPTTASFGELALNGRVKPVQGVLGRLLSLQKEGIEHVIGPAQNEKEARAIQTIHYEGVETLKEAVMRYSGIQSQSKLSGHVQPPHSDETDTTKDILGMIRGQTEGIRACTIAAAGWHPILLMGAPGCGKTTLASAIPEILPSLSMEESIEISRIYSVTNHYNMSEGLMKKRPFRHTHHTVTTGALIGGGLIPSPGECTLAHRGVLFLDEVTEIQPRVLDALREPLETGKVHLSRADWQMTFPADFLLVAACNPCRCGHLLEMRGHCRCDDLAVRRHLARISGPLFDRFDLVVSMTRVDAQDLTSIPELNRSDTNSLTIRAKEQVQKAWLIQENRASKYGLSVYHNGRVQVPDPERYFAIRQDALKFAVDLANQNLLSVRSFFSIFRIARTIADIEGQEDVKCEDIAEAFHYKARLPFVNSTKVN